MNSEKRASGWGPLSFSYQMQFDGIIVNSTQCGAANPKLHSHAGRSDNLFRAIAECDRASPERGFVQEFSEREIGRR